MTLTEHEPANFRYGASYLGVSRSDDLVFIQITANNTRTLEQKKALFRRTAELLGDRPGIRPEDVFVSLVEVAKENWSLGRGLRNTPEPPCRKGRRQCAGERCRPDRWPGVCGRARGRQAKGVKKPPGPISGWGG